MGRWLPDDSCQDSPALMIAVVARDPSTSRVRPVGFHQFVPISVLPLFTVASVFCPCLQTAIAQIPHRTVHAHTTASCCGGTTAKHRRQGSPSPDDPARH